MSMFRSFLFFEDANAAGESAVFNNAACTDGSIEVKGDATSFSLEVQGAVDTKNPNAIEWTTLFAINETDLTTVTEIEAKGLYYINAVGKCVRVKINSISGGSLTVVGKFSE